MSVKSAKKIDPAVWVRKQHRTSYRPGMMCSCGRCPLRGCPIPQPRVSQVICSIVPAEKYDLLSDRIIGHLGGSAGRRRSVRRNLGAGNTVERPRVVQITGAIESTKHDYFAAGWIVIHRQIRARWRRTGG